MEKPPSISKNGKLAIELFVSGQLGDDVREHFISFVTDTFVPLAVVVRALIHDVSENLGRRNTGCQVMQSGVDQMHEPAQARHDFKRFMEADISGVEAIM